MKNKDHLHILSLKSVNSTVGVAQKQGTLIYINSTDAIYKLTQDCSSSDTITSLLAAGLVKDIATPVEAGTPVNAVSAQGTLTLSGVVIDGETFTIGDEIFEIDTDGVVSGSNIAINVSAHATASQGTITVSGTPIAEETLTLGGQIYTFKAARALAGEITINADNDIQVTNIIAAVTLDSSDIICTDGALSTVVVTAFTPGVAGDAIVFEETATGIAIDGAGTLGTTTAGADCTAANADGIIVTAVSAGSTLITATQGAGTTVIITVDIAGVLGNAFASTDTMANGAFGATTLGDTTLGVDGTVGSKGEQLIDATNLYTLIADNTIVDANWRKLTLLSL